MSNKKKKRAGKATKTRSERYIEPIGSPILRMDTTTKWLDCFLDSAERERLIASPGWKAYCKKAFMVFRLMQRDAAAISANQLNFPFPAFIWKYNGKFEIVLCPKIRATSEELVTAAEGCLSVRDKMVEVERANSIILEGYDHFGVPIEPRLLVGWEARIVQHEYDHLIGSIIVDYLPETDKCEYLEQIRKGGVA